MSGSKFRIMKRPGQNKRNCQGNGEKKRRTIARAEAHLESVDRVSNCFPDEILELVFLHLPIEDRKNARLVCKLWNRNCTHAVITKKEKFVFRTHCSVSDITNILQDSSQSCMNLEFHNECINHLPSDVWKIAGHKVNKVNVYRASGLKDETLRNIILYCENLTCIKMCKSWEQDTSSDLLDFFIHNSIYRTRVHNLSLFYKPPFNFISFDFIKKIFSIFPHLKHFFVEDYSQFSNDSIIFNSPKQLKSLAFGPLSRDIFREMPKLPIWDSRLTKVEVTLYDYNSVSKIFDFFTVQRELREIILRTGFFREATQDENITKKLMFHILKNCCNLRDFRFRSSESIKLNGEESAQFFTLIPNLQRLQTTDTMILQFETSALSPRDLALNVLSLGFRIQESSLLYFLKCSAQMRHLRLDFAISDAILAAIIKNMPNLQTLSLGYIDGCTTNGFTGQYPMRYLRKLEHLKLSQVRHWERLNIVEVAREFQFLPLKYLHLRMDLSPTELLSITSNTPTLECFRNDYRVEGFGRLGDISLEKIIEFCQCLKKLKYLNIPLNLTKYNLTSETYLKPLFAACPSLRYLCVGRKPIFIEGSHILKVYSFNPFTNEVVLNALNTLEYNFPYPRKKVRCFN